MATANEPAFLSKIKKSITNLIDTKSLIIASATMARDLLGVLFNFYYIKVFLTIYYLNNRWLNFVQILFAVWNVANNSMFGCVQDVGFVWCPPWLMNRRKVILYLGPFYALSFLVFWIPWSNNGQPSWVVGMQLLVSLFLYDSMASFVVSAQCGLFSEYTTEHQGRVRVVIYCEMASLLAAFVILPVDAISKSLSDFRSFQICTAVVALLSSGFFLITGLLGSDKVAQMNEIGTKSRAKPETAKESFKEGYQAAKSILSNRDFICVVLGNFFHIMRMTGDANFLAILTEALLSPNGILTIGSVQLSLFYTGCTVLSKVFLVLCWPLLHRCGAFVCLMMTLLLSAINCVVTAIIGRTYYSWLALFFLFENILAKGLWPAVYNIFLPDIIDEDMIRHKRKAPLSTMIFTLNALFTKPAYSIAPIIVVTVLNDFGYDKYLQVEKSISECNITTDFLTIPWNNGTNCIGLVNVSNSSNSSSGNFSSANQFDHLFSTMFYIACLYPLSFVILEALCFLPYRLKFRHKRDKGEKDTETENDTTRC